MYKHVKKKYIYYICMCIYVCIKLIFAIKENEFKISAETHNRKFVLFKNK